MPKLKSNSLGWQLEGALAWGAGPWDSWPAHLPISCPLAVPLAVPLGSPAGKYLARQTLALRGVVPMLAAPMSDGSGEGLLRRRAAA